MPEFRHQISTFSSITKSFTGGYFKFAKRCKSHSRPQYWKIDIIKVEMEANDIAIPERINKDLARNIIQSTMNLGVLKQDFSNERNVQQAIEAYITRLYSLTGNQARLFFDPVKEVSFFTDETKERMASLLQKYPKKVQLEIDNIITTLAYVLAGDDNDHTKRFYADLKMNEFTTPGDKEAFIALIKFITEDKLTEIEKKKILSGFKKERMFGFLKTDKKEISQQSKGFQQQVTQVEKKKVLSGLKKEGMLGFLKSEEKEIEKQSKGSQQHQPSNKGHKK